MSSRGAGSSPGFSQIFLRTAVIAPALFHSIPESSSEIRTSGRPRVVSNAVLIGVAAATHEFVPAGNVALPSTTLIPRMPHSSSLRPFTVASLWGLCSGVAASFQLSPKLLGATPGGSFHVVGSWGLPVGPVYGKSALATGTTPSASSASTATAGAARCAPRPRHPGPCPLRFLTTEQNERGARNLRSGAVSPAAQGRNRTRSRS